jgi:hypothetical protein
MLESLYNKKVLLLGKSDIFTPNEIERFLSSYNIEISLLLDDNIDAVIESRRLNPIEDNISNEAYSKGIKLYKLEKFEKIMSEKIDENQVIMAIKLSNDTKRIYRLLSNEHISDNLFLKLLDSYQWEEEEFGDSNLDRDVLTFTVKRFLTIAPNRQELFFTPLSLLNLSKETKNSNLLYALTKFPIVLFLQKNKQKLSLKESIAQNQYLNEKTIKRLFSFQNNEIFFYLASNICLPINKLEYLYQKDDININYALASNTSINNYIFNNLLLKDEETIKILLKYQKIDIIRYKTLQVKEELLKFLALNIYIEDDVSNALLEINNSEITNNLASNPNISIDIIDKIYQQKNALFYQNIALNINTSKTILNQLFKNSNREILVSLSYNLSTPVNILKKLFKLDDLEISKGIASNPSTPIEILNKLEIYR